MPTTLDWDDAEHIILYARYSGPWEVDEYLESSQRVYAAVRGENHTVYMIAHLLDERATTFPRWGPRVWLSALSAAPHNLGVIVGVPGNPTVRVMVKVVGLIAGDTLARKLQFAPTIEDARQLIRKLRDA